MVQTVKNLPAIQVPSLYCIVHPRGQEDPLKKGMASLQYSCLGNSTDRGA